MNFYNLPKQYTKEDYLGALDLTLADLKQNQSVKSVFLMGRNWVGGISDIDLVVVYNDHRPVVHPKKPFLLSEDNAYIFTHDYIRYSEDLFKYIHYIFPSKFELECLYGAQVDPKDPKETLSPTDLRLLKTSFLVDILINKILLIPLEFKRDINVRKALLWLYSFVYTIEMAEEILQTEIDKEFSINIKRLRNNWFKLGDIERKNLILDLIGEASNLSERITKKLDEFIKNNFDTTNLLNKPVFNSPSFLVRGVEDWDKDKFLAGSSHKSLKIPLINKTIKRYEVVVPNSFFVLLGVYSQMPGPYSDWFRKFLNKKPGFRINNKGINSRIENLNKAFDVNNTVITNTMVQYGFHPSNLQYEKFKANLFSFLGL